MIQKKYLWEKKWQNWCNESQSSPKQQTTFSNSNPQTQKLKEDVDTRLLRELTESEYDAVRHLIGNLRTEDLSFDNIFQGKKRLVMPFSPGPTGELKEMIKLFEYNGYKINWSEGTVEKEIETQKGPQIRKVKIGKILTKLVDLANKEQLAFKEKTDLSFELHYIDPESEKEKRNEIEKALVDKEKKSKEIENILKRDFPHYKDFGFGYTLSNVAAQLLKHWNEKGEFYRTNPEVVQGELGKHLLVLTRAPIDVLRMSDFKDITSCHSPPSRESNAGNGYYKCAVEEARGHGPVAYVVDKNDIPEDFDWEQEEVFGDGRRNVSGPQPLSRLRIRKYKHKEDGYQLAIPENRVYGADFPNLRGSLIDLLREKQLSDPDWEPSMDDDFVRYGGSYEDTKDGVLFNKFFKTNKFPDENLDHDSGNEDDFYPDEEDDPEAILIQWREEQAEMLRARVNDLYHEKARHLGPNITVETEIYEYLEENDPYVISKAKMTLKFSNINQEKYNKLDSTNSQMIADEIQERLFQKDLLSSTFIDVGETWFKKSSQDAYLVFDLKPSDDDLEMDSSDYGYFLDILSEYNEQEDEIYQVVEKVLAHYGIITKEINPEIEALKQNLSFLEITEEQVDSLVLGMEAWVSVGDLIRKELPQATDKDIFYIAGDNGALRKSLKSNFEDFLEPFEVRAFEIYEESDKISFDMYVGGFDDDSEYILLLKMINKIETDYAKDIIDLIQQYFINIAKRLAQSNAIEERNNLVNEVLKSLESKKSIIISIKR